MGREFFKQMLIDLMSDCLEDKIFEEIQDEYDAVCRSFTDKECHELQKEVRQFEEEFTKIIKEA